VGASACGHIFCFLSVRSILFAFYRRAGRIDYLSPGACVELICGLRKRSGKDRETTAQIKKSPQLRSSCQK
jgi:hypothetical protein